MSSNGMVHLGNFTAKQQAFIGWYVKLLNGTRAAEKAGYEGCMHTLAQVAAENLKKPELRAAIDRLLEESIPSPKAVLSRIGSRAVADMGAYYDSAGNLDLDGLKRDGLSHLVKGANVGRDGVSWALVDPQTATKTLARYHKLLGADTQVDITTGSLDADDIAALAQQIAAIQVDATAVDVQDEPD